MKSKSPKPVRTVAVMWLIALSQLFYTANGFSAVVIWGSSQTTVFKPTFPSGIKGIAAGDSHALAITPAGQVIGWGTDNMGQATPPAGLSNVVAVAAGQYHSLALLANGTVVAWGGAHWQLGVPPANLDSVQAIAAGGYHSLALRSNGTVVAWGYNEQGQASVPHDLESVKAIAAGMFFSMALCSNGVIRTWGHNDYGQLQVPDSLTNAAAIGAGYYHALAVTDSGQVVQWGSTLHEQGLPPLLTNAIAVDGALDYSLALTSDGRLVHWGKPLSVVATYTNQMFRQLTTISCGNRYALALQDDRPFIFEDLTDLNVFEGAYLILNANVIGSDLFIGWYHNGQLLSNLSSNSPSMRVLRLDFAGTNWSGQYQLVATNQLGSATGRVATLGIFPVGQPSPPIFTSTPSATNVPAGQELLLTATAEGLTPMTWQWQRENQDLPGANSNQLRLSEIAPAQAGWYRVGAANDMGITWSRPFYVRVYDRMSFREEPQSATFYEGYRFRLRALAVVPSSNFTYFWRKDGVTVSSRYVSSAGTGSYVDLIYTNATMAMTGNYDLVISNFTGILTSQTATVTIGSLDSPQAPSVIQHPTNTTALPGQAATLSATVLGAEPMVFQWQKEGVDVEGAVASTLVISNTQPIHYGQYRLITRNDYGVVTSDVAKISLALPPYFFRQPADLRVLFSPGNYVLPTLLNFDAAAIGDQPIVRRWYVNGTNLTDARFQQSGDYLVFRPVTNATFAYWVTDYSNAVFQCVASNIHGVVTSRLARLEIKCFDPPRLQPPVILYGSPFELAMPLLMSTGAYYTIQTSTDLANWKDHTNFFSMQSATNFLLNIPIQSQLYFRLITPGPVFNQ